MRIGLFLSCLNDTLFPDTGKAVVTVLRRLGHTVEFPQEQTCCGQMHFNTGYRKLSDPLVAQVAKTFADYEAVVVPSASCAAMLREHGQRNVHEFTELLVDVLGVTDVGAYFPHRVTYHPTCHSLRGLRIADRPYALLRAVRGLELIDLPEADQCCGFGGTFAVKNAAVSAAIGADKVGNVLATKAEVLCAVDNSCLMHVGGALSRQRTGVRTMHLAEILAST